MNNKSGINSEEYDLLVKLIKQIIEIPISDAFRKPVDYKGLDLKDYPVIVKKPMDLGTVRKNLNSQKYISVKKTLDDIQLIWDNCKLYNQEGSSIYEAAQKLEDFTAEKVRTFFGDIKYGKNNPAYKDLTKNKLSTNQQEYFQKEQAIKTRWIYWNGQKLSIKKNQAKL